MIRHYIYPLFILMAFAVLAVGCNSSGQPISPPTASKGGTAPQQPTIPNPPSPPSQPQYGDYRTLTVDIQIATTTGKAPFNAEFKSVVDGGKPPYKYQWDFDSNGITDSVDPNPSCVYASPGIFQAKLTVEDDNSTQAIEIVQIEVKFPTPNALPKANKTQGAAPLTVTFIGEDSTSQAGAAIVEYRWDFQPDGVWDYISKTDGNTQFTFEEPGNYYPVLRVTDNLGYWEEASLHIIVTF